MPPAGVGWGTDQERSTCRCVLPTCTAPYCSSSTQALCYPVLASSRPHYQCIRHGTHLCRLLGAVPCTHAAVPHPPVCFAPTWRLISVHVAVVPQACAVACRASSTLQLQGVLERIQRARLLGCRRPPQCPPPPPQRRRRPPPCPHAACCWPGGHGVAAGRCVWSVLMCCHWRHAQAACCGNAAPHCRGRQSAPSAPGRARLLAPHACACRAPAPVGHAVACCRGVPPRACCLMRPAAQCSRLALAGTAVRHAMPCAACKCCTPPSTASS